MHRGVVKSGWDEVTEFVPHIGKKLRLARRGQQLSLRELAQMAEVSPSLLSKIENGKANPSVRTLHSLAEALSVPVQHLFPEKTTTSTKPPAASKGADLSKVPIHALREANNGTTDSGEPGIGAGNLPLKGPVVKANARPTIELQGGVTWSRLTPGQEEGVEFLQVHYQAGASSGQRMSHHTGREFHYVLEGQMLLELGFERYVLQRGDSIVFNSTTPHRLSNPGQAPLWAISVVFNKE